MGRLPQAPSGDPFGAVAQLVAHLHGMEGVRGSNPLSSTNGSGRVQFGRGPRHVRGPGPRRGSTKATSRAPSASAPCRSVVRRPPPHRDRHLGEPRCLSMWSGPAPLAGVGGGVLRSEASACSAGGEMALRATDHGQNHSDSRSLGLTSDARRTDGVDRGSRRRPCGAVTVVAVSRAKVMPKIRPMTLLRRRCHWWQFPMVVGGGGCPWVAVSTAVVAPPECPLRRPPRIGCWVALCGNTERSPHPPNGRPSQGVAMPPRRHRPPRPVVSWVA